MRVRYVGSYLGPVRLGVARFAAAGDEAEVPDALAVVACDGGWFEPAGAPETEDDG